MRDLEDGPTLQGGRDREEIQLKEDECMTRTTFRFGGGVYACRTVSQ